MKKLPAVAVAAIMLALLLAGCSQASEPAAPGTDDSASGPEFITDDELRDTVEVGECIFFRNVSSEDPEPAIVDCGEEHHAEVYQTGNLDTEMTPDEAMVFLKDTPVKEYVTDEALDSDDINLSQGCDISFEERFSVGVRYYCAVYTNSASYSSGSSSESTTHRGSLSRAAAGE